MTIIIVLRDQESSYEDFNNKGMFIGTCEQFADCMFSNVTPDAVWVFAADQKCDAFFYAVPDDGVESFCADYGTGVEPKHLEVSRF